MKIYRVVKERRPGDEHDGFQFYSNKREALKAQRANNRVGKDSDHFTPDQVEVIEFTPTKKGIIEMLNIWADIPDNG